MLVTYQLDNEAAYHDVTAYLQAKKPVLKKLIQEQLHLKLALKCNLFLECAFTNVHEEENARSFKTKNLPIYLTTDVEDVLQQFFKSIIDEMDEHAAKKSGWALYEVIKLLLRINEYRPMRASSYLEAPAFISDSRFVINPINMHNNECFKYSILCLLHEGRNPERIANLLRYEDHYDFSMVEFPTPVNDIAKFERINDVTINVFALSANSKIYPIKVVDEEKPDHYDLLIIQKDDITHYCTITNFNALIRKQITGDHNPTHVCKRCFSHYPNFEKLVEHKIYCLEHPVALVTMPERKIDEDGAEIIPRVCFRGFQKMFEVPVVMYADFEASS